MAKPQDKQGQGTIDMTTTKPGNPLAPKAGDDDLPEGVEVVTGNMLDQLSREFECERLVVLKEGQMLRGVLLGNGPEAELTSIDGQPRAVATWRIRINERAIARVLGGYQLDRELPELIGQPVCIMFRAQVKTNGGKRVNDMVVFKPKGFTSAQQPRMIDVTPAPQLTAPPSSTIDGAKV